jgi:hypothetical protein
LSIYLLHFQIELMIAGILHNQRDGPIKTVAAIMGAVTLAVSIGMFIESRRRVLKSFLWLWLDRLSNNKARRRDALGPYPASAARNIDAEDK